jgi:hypothetical protein
MNWEGIHHLGLAILPKVYSGLSSTSQTYGQVGDSRLCSNECVRGTRRCQEAVWSEPLRPVRTVMTMVMRKLLLAVYIVRLLL